MPGIEYGPDAQVVVLGIDYEAWRHAEAGLRNMGVSLGQLASPDGAVETARDKIARRATRGMQWQETVEGLFVELNAVQGGLDQVPVRGYKPPKLELGIPNHLYQPPDRSARGARF